MMAVLSRERNPAFSVPLPSPVIAAGMFSRFFALRIPLLGSDPAVVQKCIPALPLVGASACPNAPNRGALP